jgi:hypothetical protein
VKILNESETLYEMKTTYFIQYTPVYEKFRILLCESNLSTYSGILIFLNENYAESVQQQWNGDNIAMVTS